MKTHKIAILLALLLACLGNPVLSFDAPVVVGRNDVADFARWCEDVGIATGGVGGEAFHRLRALGPNALPALVEGLREVDEFAAAMHFMQAIGIISGISVVQREHMVEGRGNISREEMTSRLKEDGTRPSLVQPDVSPKGLSPLEKKEVLLNWWAGQDEISVKNRVRTIIQSLVKVPAAESADEKTRSESLRKRDLSLEGSAIVANGVFSLPQLIETVGETNSDVAFCLFLNCSRNVHGDHQEFLSTGGKSQETHEEKIAYIRKWWERDKSKYTSLPTLSSLIEEAVSSLPNR